MVTTEASSVEYRLTCEAFVVPRKGSFILYAPLKGVVAKLNPAAVILLNRIRSGEKFALSGDQKNFLENLVRCDVVNGSPDPRLDVEEGKPFVPTHTTLFLTNACNLRCVYCYANGGSALHPKVIPSRAARAAIDRVSENAAAKGMTAFSVGLHGAGEPTVAWDRYQEVATYADGRAAELGLQASICTATNGVMPEARARWVVEHTDAATVSVDGMAEVHDVQRPTAGGGPSFQAVERTMRVFDELKFSYAIRATITRLNVTRMAAMVEYFDDNFAASDLQFDPLLYAGRCLHTGWEPAEEEEFITEFNKAYDVARSRGRILGFSSVSFSGLKSYFCCACSDGFAVTHDGHVTACFEAFAPEQPFADRFVYGRFDDATGTFDLDVGKLGALRKRHVYNLDYCRDCFCKYMCCGDCPMHVLQRAARTGEKDGLRCRSVQGVAAHRLGVIVDQTNGGVTK